MRLLVIDDDAAIAIGVAEQLGCLFVIEGASPPAGAEGSGDMPVRLMHRIACLEPPLAYIGEGKRQAQWKSEVGRHRRR